MALNLAGCANRYKIPSAEVCIELPEGNAFCTWTTSEEERFLTKEEWDAISRGRFSMSATDFAKYQGFIKEVCAKEKCTAEQKKIIKRWENISRETLKMVH